MEPNETDLKAAIESIKAFAEEPDRVISIKPTKMIIKALPGMTLQETHEVAMKIVKKLDSDSRH